MTPSQELFARAAPLPDHHQPEDHTIMSETLAPEAPVAATAPAGPCPTEPGTPYAGGFYAGRLRIAGVLHALIVAPKAEGTLCGPWHADSADVPGARDCADGMANTRAMAAAGSEIAQQALAARIGGFEDWHIPARDALELMYRNLKPTDDENACTYRDGDNPSSVPVGYPYTATSPVQTDALPFRSGGPEAFDTVWHWSSTQDGRNDAYYQGFANGYTLALYEGWSRCVARLARQIPLQ